MVRAELFVSTLLGDACESVSFGDGPGIVRHGSEYRFVGVSARVRPSLSRLVAQIPRPIQTARPATLEFSRRPSASKLATRNLLRAKISVFETRCFSLRTPHASSSGPTTNILSPTRRAIVFNTIPENSEGGYHPAPLRVRPGSIDQDNVAACHLAQVLIRFHGEQAIEGWFPETQLLAKR